MTKKAVDLGIDIGNNFIKICGREKTIIRPSAVVPLESLPYSLDNIKNERLDVFCDHSGVEKKQYIWGEDLSNLGDLSLDFKGTTKKRYSSSIYKHMLLFSVSAYLHDTLNQKHLSVDYEHVNLSIGILESSFVGYVEEGQDDNFDWIFGDHYVSINNTIINFKIDRLHVMPQELGSLFLFNSQSSNNISNDIRTKIIDYGGTNRIRATYDGFNKLNQYDQDRNGTDIIVNSVKDYLISSGLTNNRRNNHLKIEKMLVSNNYSLKEGLDRIIDLTDTFSNFKHLYRTDRIEEDYHSNIMHNDIDLLILTGGGSLILNASTYPSNSPSMWQPDNPLTANAQGYLEAILKQNNDEETFSSLFESKDTQKENNVSVGDLVQISSSSINTLDGKVIEGHQDWIGIIDYVHYDDEGIPNYYTIKYSDDQSDTFVKYDDFTKII